MILKINSSEITINLYNIQIPFLKELMLKSHKYLPYTFFSKNCFERHTIRGDSSRIHISEWIPFHNELISCFAGRESFDTMFQNFNDISYKMNFLLDNELENLETNYINLNEINTIVKYFILLHTFSSLNYLYNPSTDYGIKNWSNDLVDKVGVSDEIPYRIENRLMFLDLLLANYENTSEINFFGGNGLYRQFYLDLIYTGDEEYINKKTRRNLLSEIRKRNKESIIEEKTFLQNKWREQRKKANSIIKKYTDSYEKRALLFLKFVCTEEEVRHKLDTKFFYFLGKLLRKLEMEAQSVTYDSLRLHIRVYNERNQKGE